MKKLLLYLCLLISVGSTAQERIRDSYVSNKPPTFQPTTYPAINVDTLTTPWTVYKKQNSGTPWNIVIGYYKILYGSPEVTVTPTPPPADGLAITVMPTGGDDRATLQSALDAAFIQGRPIALYGKIYKVSNTIWIEKDFRNLQIRGYGAEIQTMNNNTFTILKRRDPVDNNEALNTMVNAMYHIDGLILYGTNAQIGFEPGPSYSSTYENMVFLGLGTGMYLRFSLATDVRQMQFVNCVNGLIIGYGNWPLANNFNSQSNHTTATKIRCYMPSNGNVAIGVYACSGVEISHSIIEGFKVINGIDFDGMESTVVKDFTLKNIHFECSGGATNAFIKFRIAGGILTIDKCFGQYPAIFLDASSTSGMCYVEVAHVPWWVGQGELGGSNGKGKCFRTSNIAMHFEKNQSFNALNASQFDGPMPTPAGNPPNEGNTLANYYTYTINRISPYQ